MESVKKMDHVYVTMDSKENIVKLKLTNVMIIHVKMMGNVLKVFANVQINSQENFVKLKNTLVVLMINIAMIINAIPREVVYVKIHFREKNVRMENRLYV